MNRYQGARVTMSISLLLFSGCVAVTLHEPTARPVRLVAAQGFTLVPANLALSYLRARDTLSDDGVGEPCRVSAVTAEVWATRGDTLVLTNLRDLDFSAFGRCRPAAVSMVVVSQHPTLRAEQRHANLAAWFAGALGLGVFFWWVSR